MQISPFITWHTATSHMASVATQKYIECLHSISTLTIIISETDNSTEHVTCDTRAQQQKT